MARTLGILDKGLFIGYYHFILIRNLYTVNC